MIELVIMNYYDLVASDNPQGTQKQINERLNEQNNLIAQQNSKIESIETEMHKQNISNNKQFKKSHTLNLWVLVVSVISCLVGIAGLIVALIKP